MAGFATLVQALSQATWQSLGPVHLPRLTDWNGNHQRMSALWWFIWMVNLARLEITNTSKACP